MLTKGSVRPETATAAGFGGKPSAKLLLLVFKRVVRNTLRGFVTVRYGSLTIHDCPVHAYPNGRVWVSLPAKPILDDAGSHKRDPATGKPSYTPILEWPTRAISDQFSEAVIAQLRERFPGALDGSGER